MQARKECHPCEIWPSRQTSCTRHLAMPVLSCTVFLSHCGLVICENSLSFFTSYHKITFAGPSKRMKVEKPSGAATKKDELPDVTTTNQPPTLTGEEQQPPSFPRPPSPEGDTPRPLRPARADRIIVPGASLRQRNTSFCLLLFLVCFKSFATACQPLKVTEGAKMNLEVTLSLIFAIWKMTMTLHARHSLKVNYLMQDRIDLMDLMKNFMKELMIMMICTRMRRRRRKMRSRRMRNHEQFFCHTHALTLYLAVILIHSLFVLQTLVFLVFLIWQILDFLFALEFCWGHAILHREQQGGRRGPSKWDFDPGICHSFTESFCCW